VGVRNIREKLVSLCERDKAFHNLYFKVIFSIVRDICYGIFVIISAFVFAFFLFRYYSI